MTFNIEKFKIALVLTGSICLGLWIIFIVVFAAAYINIPKDEDLNWKLALSAFSIMLALFVICLINLIDATFTNI